MDPSDLENYLFGNIGHNQRQKISGLESNGLKESPNKEIC